MGISVLTTRAEYDLMEVFRAIAYDINDRMGAPKSPADEAIISRNTEALDIVSEWMNGGQETFVTEFLAPTEPRLGGDSSLDIVSQILNTKFKPQHIYPS